MVSGRHSFHSGLTNKGQGWTSGLGQRSEISLSLADLGHPCGQPPTNKASPCHRFLGPNLQLPLSTGVTSYH